MWRKIPEDASRHVSRGRDARKRADVLGSKAGAGIHRAKFLPVFNRRKRKVPGRWCRRGSHRSV